MTFSVPSNISHLTVQVSPISNKRESILVIPFRNPTKIYKSNNFRKIFANLVMHKYFDYFMNFLTFFSMILTTQETPLINPTSSLMTTLYILEILISTIYILEFLFKVLAFGFYIDSSSYLKHSLFNHIEFINVIISFLLIINIEDPAGALYVLKCLRAFKIIKLILFSHKELNIIGDCLLHSLRYVLKLLFFYGIFVFCFSLFAMKYLKGTLFRCTDYDTEFQIDTKEDCFDHGGNWVNSDTPYDNILIAFFTLFEVSSSEGWSEIMFKILCIYYSFF